MSCDVQNECVINGVPYKCRCCFDPGRRIFCLTDEASNEKTWRDLLKDVAQLQAKDDDLLPKTVCSKCLEKLKSSHDFILQIHNVNKKYSHLLSDGSHPLHDGLLNDIENYNDCLAESAISLPLELPEIKLEEGLSYDMDLSDNQQLHDNMTAKSGNEDDDDDPFTHTFDDGSKSPFDKLEENESAKAKTGQSTTKSNRRKGIKFSEEGEVGKRKKRNRKAKPPKKTDQSSDSEKMKNTVEDCDDVKDVKDPIVCGKCSHIFATKHAYQRHQQNKHSSESNQNTRNKCPLCGKEFKNKFYVVDHIKVVHDQLKPFKCEHCPKTFSSTGSRRMHALIHIDDFPYACKYCDKSYRNPYKLKIHNEIHTTKPELLCPICHRSQKSTKDLEEHVKNHDDNRLQCPSCGNLYRRSSQLKDHYNAVHLKLRPFKCGFCELGFGDRKTRTMHEKKHHPSGFQERKIKIMLEKGNTIPL